VYHARLRTVLATAGVVTALILAAAPAAAAPSPTATVGRSVHLVEPKVTGVVAHQYVVTTTADDTLWSSAPAHTCEDTTNTHLCSYRAAVAAAEKDFASAKQWDVIRLPAGDFKLSATVLSSSPVITDSGNLTIEGAGAAKSIIDGSTLNFHLGLLRIVAANSVVQLSDLTMKGGYGEAGGAALVESSSSLDVANCAFTSNGAANGGGAIFADYDAALSVTGSSFTSNTSSSGGGAIDDDSSNTLVLSGDTFNANTVSGTSFSDEGGAVFAQGNADVDHTSFAHNAAYGFGGALYATRDIVAANDVFSDNSSKSYSGGAVFADANVSLTTSAVTGNTAAGVGGGVYNDFVGTYSGDTFANNRSGEAGGDLYDDDAATVDGSTFSKGVATNSGGSIYVDDGAFLAMTNDTIAGALAEGTTLSDGGGAVYLDGIATLTDVTIKDSRAPNGSASGGGILCSTDSLLTLSADQILDNAANRVGGGVNCPEQNGTVITNSAITGNRATTGGGVATETGSILTIDDSTVDANTATDGAGGGIFVDSSQLTIDNSTVAHNQAASSFGIGGGISLTSNDSEAFGSLQNDTVAYNTADEGGGVFTSSSFLSVNSSTITRNAATSGDEAGGGIYNEGTELESTDTIWVANTGDQCGGPTSTQSGGFNLESDNSCGLSGAGDLVSDANADLGSLALNGGPTESMAPTGPSAAIGTGGGSCPLVDQRGTIVPTSQPCDIGAVFVEKTTTQLSDKSSIVTKGHEQTELFTVTVLPAVKGGRPGGTVSILSGADVVCTVTLKQVPGSKAVAFRGTCSPTPSKLKSGTYKLSAVYNTSGVYASSASATKSLRVVG
jgi:predicted outer membrane repeat protein